MRLVNEAYEELKSIDPHTAVSPYFIRQLALNGKVKSVMAGRKRLINFDDLLEYLSSNIEQVEQPQNKIRRIL